MLKTIDSACESLYDDSDIAYTPFYAHAATDGPIHVPSDHGASTFSSVAFAAVSFFFDRSIPNTRSQRKNAEAAAAKRWTELAMPMADNDSPAEKGAQALSQEDIFGGPHEKPQLPLVGELDDASIHEFGAPLTLPSLSVYAPPLYTREEHDALMSCSIDASEHRALARRRRDGRSPTEIMLAGQLDAHNVVQRWRSPTEIMLAGQLDADNVVSENLKSSIAAVESVEVPNLPAAPTMSPQTLTPRTEDGFDEASMHGIGNAPSLDKLAFPGTSGQTAETIPSTGNRSESARPAKATGTAESAFQHVQSGFQKLVEQVSGYSCESCDRSKPAPPVIVFEADDEYDRTNNGELGEDSASNGVAVIGARWDWTHGSKSEAPAHLDTMISVSRDDATEDKVGDHSSSEVASSTGRSTSGVTKLKQSVLSCPSHMSSTAAMALAPWISKHSSDVSANGSGRPVRKSAARSTDGLMFQAGATPESTSELTPTASELSTSQVQSTDSQKHGHRKGQSQFRGDGAVENANVLPQPKTRNACSRHSSVSGSSRPRGNSSQTVISGIKSSSSASLLLVSALQKN